MAIAQRHGKTVAQVLLKWQVQRGVVTIAKSFTPSRIVENATLFSWELSEAEMEVLASHDACWRAVVPVNTTTFPCWAAQLHTDGVGRERSGLTARPPAGPAASPRTATPTPSTRTTRSTHGRSCAGCRSTSARPQACARRPQPQLVCR